MNSSTDIRVANEPASTRTTPATADVQVRVAGLNKTYHRRRGESVHVLKNINVEIAKGELLVLLGPSGCGKTTLLRCLVGLEQPTEGRVDLNEKTVVDAERGIYVPPNRRDVSMVFQNYALWPHMKVRNNVAYPLKARKKKDELAAGRVEDVLKTVQCEHLADRYPPELSGGQQQRVSLARALATKPTLLLLDEPLSNLDALLRIELRAQLRHLHRTLRFTGVYVTHDQEEALALASRVAVMKAGEIEQIGRPDEVYGRPATEYVADFLGFRNRFQLTVENGLAEINGQPFNALTDSNLPAGAYNLRARPTQTLLRGPGEPAAGNVAWLTGAKIIEVLPGVNSTEYAVELDGNQLFVDLPRDVTFRPDETVDVGINLDSTHCYGQSGHRVDVWASR